MLEQLFPSPIVVGPGFRPTRYRTRNRRSASYRQRGIDGVKRCSYAATHHANGLGCRNHKLRCNGFSAAPNAPCDSDREDALVMLATAVRPTIAAPSTVAPLA